MKMLSRCLLLLTAVASAVPADGNRLTYLDDASPFWPTPQSAKFTTPQWVGEPGTFGKVRFFRQLPAEMRAAKDTPVFAEPIEIGDLGIRLNVCATDWNQDGRLDVIAGSASGKVQVFLNSPTADHTTPFAPGFTPKLPPIMQPRVLVGDLNGDGDDDLYFPSTQGTCFVERSFLNHGYARGVIVESPR